MNIELIEIEVSTAASVTATALNVVNQQVAARDAIEAGFLIMEERYKNVIYDVTTTAGMDAAKRARAEVRQVRFNVQNATKEVSSKINDVKAGFSSASEKLIERIFRTETPLDEQVKCEEIRKATEKALKEQVERDQAAKVQLSINALVLDVDLASATADQLSAALADLQSIEISLEIFGGRAGEAQQIQVNTLEQLTKLHATALTAEKLQLAMADQQRQLDAARKLFDDQQATAVAARITEDLRLAGVRQKQADDLAAARKELDDRIEAERLAEQARQEVVAQAVRDAAAADQKILDDAAAAERQHLDAIAACKRKVLDDLATAERIENARIETNASRVRDAAVQLLEALVELVDEVDTFFDQNAGFIDTNAAHNAIHLALKGK
jgi:hypothetical protein